MIMLLVYLAGGNYPQTYELQIGMSCDSYIFFFFFTPMMQQQICTRKIP